MNQTSKPSRNQYILPRIHEVLSSNNISCKFISGNKLMINLKMPRFVPFDEQAVWLSQDEHSGKLYFVLMLTFRLWEDDEEANPEEYHRRAELVDWRLIPDIRDFYYLLIEPYGLSLELEFDEAVDISLEAHFRKEEWDTVVGIINKIEQICSDWNGHAHTEEGWFWAKNTI